MQSLSRGAALGAVKRRITDRNLCTGSFNMKTCLHLNTCALGTSVRGLLVYGEDRQPRSDKSATSSVLSAEGERCPAQVDKNTDA